MKYLPELFQCYAIGFVIGALCVAAIALPIIAKQIQARRSQARWTQWWTNRSNRNFSVRL
jgi:hypothetical protein